MVVESCRAETSVTHREKAKERQRWECLSGAHDFDTKTNTALLVCLLMNCRPLVGAKTSAKRYFLQVWSDNLRVSGRKGFQDVRASLQ